MEDLGAATTKDEAICSPKLLTETAKLLGMESQLKPLDRYFLGVAQKYSGKPIRSVSSIETQLQTRFELPSRDSWVSNQASGEQLSAPPAVRRRSKPRGKAQASPLHTSRTPSGMSAIYNFGESGHLLGPDWRWHCQKSASAANPLEFQMKPQMRGRHIFGATSANPGKCFEWTVVRDKQKCGAPKFLISEFVLDETGFRGHRTPKKILGEPVQKVF